LNIVAHFGKFAEIAEFGPCQVEDRLKTSLFSFPSFYTHSPGAHNAPGIPARAGHTRPPGTGNQDKTAAAA